VVTAANQIHEHNLDNRPQPRHGRAHRRANKPHLSDGRVKNALWAKLSDQASCSPERPTPGIYKAQVRPARGTRDVFAQNHNGRTPPHFQTNRLVDGLAQGQLADGNGHSHSPQSSLTKTSVYSSAGSGRGLASAKATAWSIFSRFLASIAASSSSASRPLLNTCSRNSLMQSRSRAATSSSLVRWRCGSPPCW